MSLLSNIQSGASEQNQGQWPNTDLAGGALHSKASSTWGSSVRTRKDAQVAQKGELEVSWKSKAVVSFHFLTGLEED